MYTTQIQVAEILQQLTWLHQTAPKEYKFEGLTTAMWICYFKMLPEHLSVNISKEFTEFLYC